MRISELILPHKLLLLLRQRRATLYNLFFLYGATLISYGLPLITMPYLARILGVTSYGTLLFTQSYANFVLLVVEYGFVYSATRDLARHRESLERRTELVAGVFGAKMILTTLAIMASLVSYWIVPVFHEDPRLLASGTFWAASQAFNMFWYFQGLEDMRTIVTIDSITKTLSTGLIFLFVKEPTDAWLALVLPGLGACLSTMIAIGLVHRHTPMQKPSLGVSLGALKSGWSLFLFRGAVSFYTIGNTFILGMMTSPQNVAYFAGGERIARLFLGLLNPITQVLYPKLNNLLYHKHANALSLGRLTMVFMVVAGTFIGLLEFVFAEFLVNVFLGPGYEPAVTVLRILSLLGPLIMMNTFLGTQWMIPLGLDKPFNFIILGSGILNIVLALLLVSRYNYVGMAVGVVITEMVVASATYIYLRRAKLDPIFGYRVLSSDT